MSERDEQEHERTVGDGWVQGELLEVMESWPMQLLVRIGDENVTLDLAPDSTITSEVGTASVRDLQPGRRVRVRIEHLPGHPLSRLTNELRILAD